MTGLLFTLGLGLFILIGAGVVFLTKNNDKFVEFSISIAFGVMSSLALFELIPETIELFSTKYSTQKSLILVIICVLIGIFLLRLLDLFIPDHDDHDHHHKVSDKNRMHHIGFVSSIALVLHNIIEGMAIYGTVTTSLKLGLLVSIGVGLHNIPLGMVITSTFYKANNDKKKTFGVVLLISLSTFLGGVIMYFLAGKIISDIFLAILLSITLGMLIYILIFELLPQIIHTKYKKESVSGIIIGLLLFLVSLFLE